MANARNQPQLSQRSMMKAMPSAQAQPAAQAQPVPQPITKATAMQMPPQPTGVTMSKPAVRPISSQPPPQVQGILTAQLPTMKPLGGPASPVDSAIADQKAQFVGGGQPLPPQLQAMVQSGQIDRGQAFDRAFQNRANFRDDILRQMQMPNRTQPLPGGPGMPGAVVDGGANSPAEGGGGGPMAGLDLSGLSTQMPQNAQAFGGTAGPAVGGPLGLHQQALQQLYARRGGGIGQPIGGLGL